MHRRAVIALAALILGAGVAAGYAASGTGVAQAAQTSGQSTQESNTQGTVGSDVSGRHNPTPASRSSHQYLNTGADAATARRKGMNPAGAGSPSTASNGSTTGGYVAAGIGVAALIGLFASRKSRESSRPPRRYDDQNRPGVGPTGRA